VSERGSGIYQRLQKCPPGGTVLLYEDEAQLLLRTRPVEKKGAGAPAHLRQFHIWMAVHRWWLCDCEDNKPLVADQAVARCWSVSAKTAAKYAAEHREIARQTARAIDANNIGQWISAYRALGATVTPSGPVVTVTQADVDALAPATSAEPTTLTETAARNAP
jgi:hypothetical protein